MVAVAFRFGLMVSQVSIVAQLSNNESEVENIWHGAVTVSPNLQQRDRWGATLQAARALQSFGARAFVVEPQSRQANTVCHNSDGYVFSSFVKISHQLTLDLCINAINNTINNAIQSHSRCSIDRIE